MAADPSIEELTIRPAAAVDEALIRRMVRAERLDPTHLHWPDFLIAEIEDTVVGIGQIRRHKTCAELGSLAVTASYRQRGVASALIQALEAQAGRPLYLMCAGRMQPFYERFGYRPIGYRETPAPLRLKRLVMLPFRLASVRVIAMRKDN